MGGGTDELYSFSKGCETAYSVADICFHSFSYSYMNYMKMGILNQAIEVSSPPVLNSCKEPTEKPLECSKLLKDSPKPVF